VPDAIRQRREPVQVRSRETVARILEATADLIEMDGADAATTRAIADRVGASVPSLYRFFADRDEVFDRLLSAQLAELDRHVEATEATWEVESIRDFVSRELDLHVAYYENHPCSRVKLTAATEEQQQAQFPLIALPLSTEVGVSADVDLSPAPDEHRS